jgi:hypothetical protein
MGDKFLLTTDTGFKENGGMNRQLTHTIPSISWTDRYLEKTALNYPLTSHIYNAVSTAEEM